MHNLFRCAINACQYTIQPRSRLHMTLAVDTKCMLSLVTNIRISTDDLKYKIVHIVGTIEASSRSSYFT